MQQATCSELRIAYTNLIKNADDYRTIFESLKQSGYKDPDIKRAVLDIKKELQKLIKFFRENMDRALVSFGGREVFLFEAVALRKIMSEVNEDLRQFREKHGYGLPPYTEESFSSRFEEDPFTHFVDTFSLNDQPISKIPKSLALLTHINTLFLEYTAIDKIEHLENFPDLVCLDLDSCKNITDPTPLLALPKMESLSLSNTGIDPQKYRKELEKLKRIQGDALTID